MPMIATKCSIRGHWRRLLIFFCSVGLIALGIPDPLPRECSDGVSLFPAFALNHNQAVAEDASDLASPIQIDIEDVGSSAAIGPERGAISLRLSIAIRVHNRTTTAVSIERGQFQLLVNGDPATFRDFGPGPEIGNVAIAPLQQVSANRRSPVAVWTTCI